ADGESIAPEAGGKGPGHAEAARRDASLDGWDFVLASGITLVFAQQLMVQYFWIGGTSGFTYQCESSVIAILGLFDCSFPVAPNDRHRQVFDSADAVFGTLIYVGHCDIVVFFALGYEEPLGHWFRERVAWTANSPRSFIMAIRVTLAVTAIS